MRGSFDLTSGEGRTPPFFCRSFSSVMRSVSGAVATGSVRTLLACHSRNDQCHHQHAGGVRTARSLSLPVLTPVGEWRPPLKLGHYLGVNTCPHEKML
jgi:hypothetical protein